MQNQKSHKSKTQQRSKKSTTGRDPPKGPLDVGHGDNVPVEVSPQRSAGVDIGAEVSEAEAQALSSSQSVVQGAGQRTSEDLSETNGVQSNNPDTESQSIVSNLINFENQSIQFINQISASANEMFKSASVSSSRFIDSTMGLSNSSPNVAPASCSETAAAEEADRFDIEAERAEDAQAVKPSLGANWHKYFTSVGDWMVR